jgi:hypothetical protein
MKGLRMKCHGLWSHTRFGERIKICKTTLGIFHEDLNMNLKKKTEAKTLPHPLKKNGGKNFKHKIPSF